MFCRRQPVLSLLTIVAASGLLLAADKPDLADRGGGGVPGGFEGSGGENPKFEARNTKQDLNPK